MRLSSAHALRMLASHDTSVLAEAGTSPESVCDVCVSTSHPRPYRRARREHVTTRAPPPRQAALHDYRRPNRPTAGRACACSPS
jgi:hypothetical protein